MAIVANYITDQRNSPKDRQLYLNNEERAIRSAAQHRRSHTSHATMLTAQNDYTTQLDSQKRQWLTVMSNREKLTQTHQAQLRKQLGKLFNHEKKAERYFKSEKRDIKDEWAKHKANYDRVTEQKKVLDVTRDKEMRKLELKSE